MQKIVDVFLEIVNSQECLDMIYKNYLVESRKNIQSIDYSKLKSIIKNDEKMSLMKKYRKISGDAFIILAKLISKDTLADQKDPLEYLKIPETGDLVNLKKLCVAIINFSGDIAHNGDLILENHNQKRYLFCGIDKFKLGDDEKLNQDLEQLIKIRHELEELKDKISKLENQNNYLKEENKRALDENKSYKRELKRQEKELNDLSSQKEDLNRAFNRANEELQHKNNEIKSLNLEIEGLNKSLENAVFFDEAVVSQDVDKQISIIYTANLSFIDKIYYDIEFKNYKEIKDNIKGYIEELKSKGILKVGIQSNKLNSLTLRNIIKLGREEGISIKRIFFNTEKELIEKLIKF